MSNRLVNQAQPEQGREQIVRGEYALTRNQVFNIINAPVVDNIVDFPQFTVWRTIPGVYKPETDMYAYSMGPLDPEVTWTNLNIRSHHERMYHLGIYAFREFKRLQRTQFRVVGIEAAKIRFKEICKYFMDPEVRLFIQTYNVFRDPNLHVPAFVGR